MIFRQGHEFEKEFKKLCKKFHSLKNDFEIFCKVLEVDPRGRLIGEKGVERISGLGKESESEEFYKVRKFRCVSIKRNSKFSGIRIIYKYCETSQDIEFEQIEFIEIYHKNQRTNHDEERIRKYT